MDSTGADSVLTFSRGIYASKFNTKEKITVCSIFTTDTDYSVLILFSVASDSTYPASTYTGGEAYRAIEFYDYGAYCCINVYIDVPSWTKFTVGTRATNNNNMIGFAK